MAIKDEIKAFIKAIIFDHVDPYLHFLDKLSWQQILNMNRQIAINKLTLIGGWNQKLLLLKNEIMRLVKVIFAAFTGVTL